MKKILILSITLSLLACNSSEKKETREEGKIGKYLYIDTDSTLHIQNNCMGFMLDDKKDSGVKRVLCNSVPSKYLNKTCKYCVTDKVYEELKELQQEDWTKYVQKDSLNLNLQ